MDEVDDWDQRADEMIRRLRENLGEPTGHGLPKELRDAIFADVRRQLKEDTGIDVLHVNPLVSLRAMANHPDTSPVLREQLKRHLAEYGVWFSDDHEG